MTDIEAIQSTVGGTPRLQDRLDVVDCVGESEIAQLVGLFKGGWWTRERTESDVRRMLEHTDLVQAARVRSTGELVGFVRVLTDRVFKAFVFDLIVAPGLRDRGVGRLLLERILAHPTLAKVHHFEPYCLPEMVPYYEQWGFGAGLDVQLMRLDRRFS
jgi:GNAT superfamily N-acetyltransferase